MLFLRVGGRIELVDLVVGKRIEGGRGDLEGTPRERPLRVEDFVDAYPWPRGVHDEWYGLGRLHMGTPWKDSLRTNKIP